MEEPITLLNDLERLNSEMDVLFSDMQGKDDSSASRISSLEQLLEEEKARARDKDVFLNSAKSAIKDKEEEVSKIWALSEELRSESSGLKAILKAKEAEIASAEKRFLAAAAENKTFAFAIKELQGRLDAAAVALQDEKAGAQSHEKQKKEILDTLNVTRAQCSAKAAETQKLGSSILELEVRLDNVTRDLEEEKAGRQSLEEQKKEILAALDRARLEAAGKAAQAQKLEASLVELQIRFDSVSKLLEEEKNKTRDSLVLISSARSSIKDKEDEAGKIWAMLEEAKVRGAELQNTLKEKEGELERAVRSRQALESELQKTAAAAAQSEQGFCHKIELLKRELRERDKDDGKTSLSFAELEKNGAEIFTELMAAREELKSLKARAAENESVLTLERNKSRKLEQDLQLLASKARKDGAEPKIGRLLEQKDEIIANLNGKIDALENSGQAAAADHAAALKRGGSQPDSDLADLLAGISHQVSNSVGIIRSNAEFCLEAPEAADLKGSLVAIVRNIVSLQKKIEDMLGFSRPITLQYVDTGFRTAAEEALAAAGKAADISGIRVSFSEDPGLKTLKADRVRLVSALEQVFLNASDAMPGGGEIRVALKNDREGGQIIEIADTGGGIESKNLSTVFHPFFTTKPGRMGLGLPLAKNIIKAHGGSIKISSTPGKGTVVSITLPAKSS